MNVNCPACDSPVPVPDDAELAEVIVCAACDAELEVVATDPPALMPFEEEEK